jgi:DNA-binding transcriptional LysR family regulator
MRFEQLEYLLTVARCGSFKRASDLLHVSQPALSESVRKLERELGVELLDRGRDGTRISAEGRELMPLMSDVLDAADRLKEGAAIADHSHRVIHIGTVTAARAPVLSPTIRTFSDTHPDTAVEVVTAQQDQIHAALRDGGMDLGLVNYLEGEHISDEFETTELVRGRPVLCISTDSRLADQETLQATDLLEEPLIAMRPGYVMYRYLERLFGGRAPAFSFSADGSEMGKMMVAEGLGVALLPDYSIVGDPLEVSGAITYREIEGDDTAVLLVVQTRRSASRRRDVDDLHGLLLDRARLFSEL